MLLDEAIDEGKKQLAGARQDKRSLRRHPVKLEAGGEGGDPNLTDRGIWGDDKLAGGLLEDPMTAARTWEPVDRRAAHRKSLNRR